MVGMPRMARMARLTEMLSMVRMAIMDFFLQEYHEVNNDKTSNNGKDCKVLLY